MLLYSPLTEGQSRWSILERPVARTRARRRDPGLPDAVYPMLTMRSTLVAPLPIGTNLGLLQLRWMRVSGRLLATRGAVIPGLRELGLSAAQVHRAWAALGHDAWASDDLLGRWVAHIAPPAKAAGVSEK